MSAETISDTEIPVNPICVMCGYTSTVIKAAVKWNEEGNGPYGLQQSAYCHSCCKHFWFYIPTTSSASIQRKPVKVVEPNSLELSNLIHDTQNRLAATMLNRKHIERLADPDFNMRDAEGWETAVIQDDTDIEYYRAVLAVLTSK